LAGCLRLWSFVWRCSLAGFFSGSSGAGGSRDRRYSDHAIRLARAEWHPTSPQSRSRNFPLSTLNFQPAYRVLHLCADAPFSALRVTTCADSDSSSNVPDDARTENSQLSSRRRALRLWHGHLAHDYGSDFWSGNVWITGKMPAPPSLVQRPSRGGGFARDGQGIEARAERGVLRIRENHPKRLGALCGWVSKNPDPHRRHILARRECQESARGCIIFSRQRRPIGCCEIDFDGFARWQRQSTSMRAVRPRAAFGFTIKQ